MFLPKRRGTKRGFGDHASPPNFRRDKLVRIDHFNLRLVSMLANRSYDTTARPLRVHVHGANPPADFKLPDLEVVREEATRGTNFLPDKSLHIVTASCMRAPLSH